jgi:hypothetical protein
MRLPLVLLLLAALVASGCSMFEAIQEQAAEGPRPCVEVYSRSRCLAMVDQAAAEISKTRADVTAATIIPDPPPDGAVLGGAWSIRLRVTLADGSSHDARMCGGLPSGPACTDDPRLSAASVTGPGSGYRDAPCGGEPPDGCPTPFPSLDPDAVEAATPLTIADRTVAIERNGRQEISLGEASLPNGILTEAWFEFLEVWPDDVALAGGLGWIEVRSLEPDGRPFDNYYLHGWREGIERVEAFLILDVLWFEPDADLAIRDVVVR